MDPTISDAHVNLGRLFHKSGQLAQSEEHYRAALAIDAVTRLHILIWAFFSKI